MLKISRAKVEAAQGPQKKIADFVEFKLTVECAVVPNSRGKISKNRLSGVKIV